MARTSTYISSQEADGAHTLGEGARDCKVRSSIVIWEYKCCCSITLRATQFVCVREDASCGHLLPSQPPLANQEVFLILTSEEQP